MDKTDQIILTVTAIKLPKIIIETNYGYRYTSDLSKFKKVYCFPTNQKEWESVDITESGFNLTWSTRFEVSVDQIIDAAESVEEIKHTAIG